MFLHHLFQESVSHPKVSSEAKAAAASEDLPSVDDLLKFITGEEVASQGPPKLDKKQRKKLKKVSSRTTCCKSNTRIIVIHQTKQIAFVCKIRLMLPYLRL